MSYQAYPGWFYDRLEALSTDKYWLVEESEDLQLGEPVVWAATGFEINPKRKNKIKAYDSTTPGIQMPLGVSLDYRLQSSGVDRDEIVERSDKYYPREIAICKVGVVSVKNVATGTEIDLNDTVIPAINGCTSIAYHDTGVWDQKSTLGKSLEQIGTEEYGLIWVNPESFEKNDVEFRGAT